ncbi:hypothetical protein Agub_g8625 [Astrephomene gubernaculifera]|uniref:S5 DRBM domain-containing protein n=1 Tax=Astrephomene gubernaculifera TaxID=47775 RepID=A0AAD3DUQ6_9CHLO|nr:hypothetical protein Agub_g8625 [Astrephomene gubernaculifera]
MAQRHLLRGACRVLAETRASFAASASSKHGNNASTLRSVLGKVHGGAAPAAGLSQGATLRGLQFSGMPVSAFQTTSPMGFAASAPSVAGPISVLGSVAQHRGVSSTELAEEADGEDADPTYLRRVDLQNSLRPSAGEDEPPDLMGLLAGGSREAEDPRRQPGPGGPRGPRREENPDAAAFELLAAARETFTRRPDAPHGGPLPPLPRELREAMFGHRWERVLVDVRRAVLRPPGEGKVEQYTAMVASGNMAGLLGLGLGTAETAQLAMARAHLDSLTRLTAVPLYRGHTVFHQLDHEYHHMKIRIQPRPEGWGLCCSDLMYELCNVVGIRNISIKIRGRRVNKFFVAQCFQEALLKQTTPHDGVEATGMYVREVYHKKHLPWGLKRGVDVP